MGWIIAIKEWAKKAAKFLIIYYPVLVVALQSAANIIYAVSLDLYRELYFYIGAVCGLSWLTAIFMLAFYFSYNFCKISRVCVLAEVAFCFVDLFCKNDIVYNYILQIGIGSTSLLITDIIFKTWTKEQS